MRNSSGTPRSTQWRARIVLLLGNFVTGVVILGPAGMLGELAASLHVSVQQAGWLVTWGAVALFLSSPFVVWATSRLDRRILLTVTTLLLALLHMLCATVSSYSALLTLRVIAMPIAVLFTPVAASTIALIVPERERAGAIAFIFLGFSLALVAGLPSIAFLAAHVSWQAAFLSIGSAALLCAVLLLVGLPRGVRGVALHARSWLALAHLPIVRLLLLVTVLQVSGQFVVFTYLAPLSRRLADADVRTIGLLFSLFGLAGLIGNVAATRFARTLQPYPTARMALLSMLLGFCLWSFGAGMLAIMGAGVLFWGLGFAALNSMQQARLAAAAPALASAAIALNTSCIYSGQAVGSAVGGALLARDQPQLLGYAAILFTVMAYVALLRTGRMERASAPA